MFARPASFLHQFSYLFFVDIYSLAFDNNYADYEKREPGYAQAMIEAYLWAFEQPLNRKIDTAFLLGIHKRAMQHLPSVAAGQFKTDCNHFLVALPERVHKGKTVRGTNPNLTLEGFREFIATWMVGQKQPMHFIHFKSADTDIYFTPVNGFGEKGLWMQVLLHGNLVYLAPYNEAEHQPMLEQALIQAPFKCFINSLASADQLRKYWQYTDSIQQIATKRADSICEDYNKAILQAKTDKEKIRVIVKHVQLLSQAHGFYDGNTREGVIAINRLLDEEGMVPALFLNPNRIEGFSVDQLVQMVEEGQAYFLQLCQEKIPEFKDAYILKTPVPTPQALTCTEPTLNRFVDVMRKHAQAYQAKMAAQEGQANKPSTPRPNQQFNPVLFPAARLINAASQPQEETVRLANG